MDLVGAGRNVLKAVSGLLVLVGPACAQAPQVNAVPPADCASECAALAQAPETDIRELIRQVAADASLRIVIDPRVHARVEYAGGPLEDIDYATLLAILRVHGFIATEIGGQTTIIPDANARMMPTRLLQSDDPSVSDHEVVSRVIAVDSGAEQLVPILRPLVPQYGHVAATASGLIVVDHYDNVRRLTAIVNQLSQ